jgi:hypothetical protein
MCTKSYHDELKQDWERFEDATQPGGIKQSAGIFWESRHCRRCRCALAHPRDLARYGIHVSLRQSVAARFQFVQNPASANARHDERSAQ